MATSTTVRFVCDLPHDDGLVEAALTGVEVRHGRRRVVVDLCAAHAGAVLGVLEHGTRPTTVLRAAPAAPAVSGAVREWARSTGLDIAPRGRVPRRVVEAYLESMAG